MKSNFGAAALAVALSTLVALPGSSSAAVPSGLTGTIKADGSSTVYPITEAVAEEFGKAAPGTHVTVGISGTGGGFKKFCAGETDISNASRPIKSTEIEFCSKNGIEYIELPVAYDALTIVVNPKNTWAHSITVAELKKIWEPEAQGKIMTWNQIRPDWPNKPLKLFGPGVDSGTFDYFTEAVVGKERASRGDFTSSEDDNTLVQGVASDEGALGYFGLAYYMENQKRLRALPVDDGKDDNGKGPQTASVENVLKGTYRPLARPIFIYVSRKAAERPEVAEFVKFYTQNSTSLAKEVGYVPVSPEIAKLAQERFNHRVSGSVYTSEGAHVGMTLHDLMKRSS